VFFVVPQQDTNTMVGKGLAMCAKAVVHGGVVTMEVGRGTRLLSPWAEETVGKLDEFSTITKF